MSLQIRPNAEQATVLGTRAVYSPSRDILHLYPRAVQTVEDWLYDGPDRDIADWLQEAGVSDTDKAEAVRTFCIFLNEAHKNPEETVQDVMTRCGFLEVPPAVRIALWAYLGSVMGGVFFQGLRDTVVLGAETMPQVARLMKTGEEASRYGAMSPLGRWWWRLKRKCFPPKRTYVLDE